MSVYWRVTYFTVALVSSGESSRGYGRWRNVDISLTKANTFLRGTCYAAAASNALGSVNPTGFGL